MPEPLSVFIITQNEADRIGPAVQAIKGIADEILVVDSGSTDDTVAIARSMGARVVFNKWPGYGLQKQFAEDQCRNDWLLNIDADEVVSEQLAGEIKRALGGDTAARAYKFAIVEVCPGEEKPPRFAYTQDIVRLYRKSAGRYSSSLVHDRVVLNPGVSPQKLKGMIFHHSVRSMGQQMEKFLAYSDLQMEDFKLRKRRISWLRLVGEFPVSFFKSYFFRRHFLRGFYGYAIAVNYAYYRHIRLVKLWESMRHADRTSPQPGKRIGPGEPLRNKDKQH